jgi:hypothetical protein
MTADPYNSDMTWTWPSMADVALEVRDTLRRGDEAHARRLVFRFIESSTRHLRKPA